ncbi:MAG: hypothetical protein EXR79_07495 [Myxococcales bacterium]|nr:hypothetical protein [Myxococcales bacterium]
MENRSPPAPALIARLRSAGPALAVLLTFGVQACSDTVVHGMLIVTDAKGDTSKKLFGDTTKPTTTGSDGSVSVTSDAEDQAPLQREIIVLLNTDAPQVMGPTAFLPIQAKVVDYALGAPADGVAVFWKLVANQGFDGPGPGSLDAEMTPTDLKGLIGNVFRANKGPAVNYKVELSCEGAESVTVDITVTDTPKGHLRVHMTYDNQVPLGQVAVRVMPAPFTCASFKPTQPAQNFLASKTTVIEDTPEFQNLPGEKKYGVYVIGKDPDGHLTAAGCADAILIVDKQTTDVTVSVFALALFAPGPYDMVNHFDFTGAIPGQLGKVLDTAVQIFYDPGAFIISQIKNLIKQLLPSIIVDAVFGLFENQLAKVVTDWLLTKSPPWLQDFFQMGQDVLQIVKNLEMLGVLTLFKVSNDFFVKGEISFTGVNLYWKLGCDKKDPNYKTCGKIPLDMKAAVNDPNFPFNLLAGTLTGTISQQKKLAIDSGTIKLNYGKLILYVLMFVVLKKITGETSFTGAMQKLIGCEGIAKGIGGSILGKLGLSENTVKNACNSAVALIVLPIEQLLGGLALDSKLSLNGTCTMVDENDDLKVDMLIDGVWVGNIVADTPGKPFKGDFTAVRQAGF